MFGIQIWYCHAILNGVTIVVFVKVKHGRLTHTYTCVVKSISLYNENGFFIGLAIYTASQTLFISNTIKVFY